MGTIIAYCVGIILSAGPLIWWGVTAKEDDPNDSDGFF